MKIAFLLLTALLIQEAGNQEAETPTADQVVARFIDALGGEMQLQDLDSRNIRIKGRVGGSEGITHGDLEWIYSGERKLFRLSADTDDVWHVFGTDGKVFWRSHDVADDENVADIHSRDTTMLDKEPGWFNTAPQYYLSYLDFEGQIEMIGDETFNDEAVWHLKFTDPEGNKINRYFSQSSRLMVGSKGQRKDSTTQTNFYNYQDIDGVMWFSRIVTEFGDRQEMELTEIKLDADISDISFSPDE